MINWLRRFNVTTRILSLAIFLLIAMIAELTFFMFELNILKQSSYEQQDKVQQETQWLEQESQQLAIRDQVQQLQQQSQQIQKTFSDMLFLYFDGIVTEYYESLNEATDAADRLEQQLARLSSDTLAAPKIKDTLATLAEYREYMDSAVTYYHKGKTNLAQSEIGDANIEAKALNEQLLGLNKLFQQRLDKADSAVLHALDETLKASVVVNSLSVNSSEQIGHLQNVIWLMILLSLPITVGVAVIIIMSITRPLKKLKQQLVSIEKNSDLTQDLTIEGDDEIKEMSEATQRLLLKLRTTLDDVGTLAVELKEAANNGLQVSINTHTQSTQQQRQSEGIAAAATQLGASSENISQTTEKGLNLVSSVADAANEGQQDVQATADNMHRLAEQFDSVESTVKELVKHSTNIGQVLEVIRSIADQTNLLALNAAIEAARAGDQGRGFAVVADEVRTLAQRTSESTNEIQEMVEALQKFSGMAANSLTTNREQVDHSVQLSDQAKTSLTKIVGELDQLVDANKMIAIITSEQQQAVLEVDENVQEIQQLAVNVEEQARTSTNVSESLKELADKLQKQLMVFRH